MAYAMLVNPVEKEKQKMATATAKKAGHKKPAHAQKKRQPVVITQQGGRVVHIQKMDVEKQKKKRRKNPDATKMMAAEMAGGAVIGVGAMVGMDWVQGKVPVEYVQKINPKAMPLIKGGIVSGLSVIVAKVAKNKTVRTVAASAAVSSAGVALFDTARIFLAESASKETTAKATTVKGGGDSIQTDYNWDFSQSAIQPKKPVAVGAPMRAPMAAPMRAPMRGTLPANGPLPAISPLNGFSDDDSGFTGNC